MRPPRALPTAHFERNEAQGIRRWYTSIVEDNFGLTKAVVDKLPRKLWFHQSGWFRWSGLAAKRTEGSKDRY